MYRTLHSTSTWRLEGQDPPVVIKKDYEPLLNLTGLWAAAQEIGYLCVHKRENGPVSKYPWFSALDEQNRGRRKMFITKSKMRQVDWAAAQHLVSPFSSPFFGVKLLNDYGLGGLPWGEGSEVFDISVSTLALRRICWTYLSKRPFREWIFEFSYILHTWCQVQKISQFLAPKSGTLEKYTKRRVKSYGISTPSTPRDKNEHVLPSRPISNFETKKTFDETCRQVIWTKQFSTHLTAHWVFYEKCRIFV